MEDKFNQIDKEIKKAKKILLLTHKAPDGDAISSVLAFNRYLKRKKKKVFIWLPSILKFLSFLPGFEDIKKPPFSLKEELFDLIIVLDYAEKKRIEVSPQFFLNPSKIISIDHHPGKGKIGKIKLNFTKAVATTEILYYFLKYKKEKIDKEMATIILAGILTDTVGFSFGNKKTEEIIKDLLEKGAEFFRLVRSYRELSLGRARLLAKMILRIKKDERLNLIYSWLSCSDFKKEKEKMIFDSPPIFPDFLSLIKEAEIFLLFNKRKKRKLKVSLRSRNEIDVSKIAKKFGGGGHKKASGFTVLNKKIPEILEEIKEELKQKK